MWKSGRLEVTWGCAVGVALAMAAGAGSILPLAALSALCHELGHLAALAAAGAEVERFRLTAFGAEIRADTRYLPYGREILCTLAGPAVNLVLALVLARAAGDYALAGANLLLGLFNLLPIPSLDGGRALYLFLSWRRDPIWADQICRRAGLGCSLGLTAVALLLTLWHGAGLFLLLGAVGTLLPQLDARRSSGGRLERPRRCRQRVATTPKRGGMRSGR